MQHFLTAHILTAVEVEDREVISPALRRRVNRELQPGETIVWMGKPVPRYFTAASTVAFLFGAIALAAWVFSMTANSHGAPFRYSFDIGRIFLLFLLAPLFVFHSLRSVVYVVTDHRAFSVQQGIVRSYYPSQLKNIHRIDHRNGIGDVIVSDDVEVDGAGRPMKLGFERVRDPGAVEALFRELSMRGDDSQALPPKL